MPSKRYAAKKRAIARAAGRGGVGTAERPVVDPVSVGQAAVSSVGALVTSGARVGVAATNARPAVRGGHQPLPLSVKYSYVPSELKRVAVMAAAMFALLIVLSFVFR